MPFMFLKHIFIFFWTVMWLWKVCVLTTYLYGQSGDPCEYFLLVTVLLTRTICCNFVSAWSSNQMKFLKVINDLNFFLLVYFFYNSFHPTYISVQAMILSWLFFFLAIKYDCRINNLSRSHDMEQTTEKLVWFTLSK